MLARGEGLGARGEGRLGSYCSDQVRTRFGPGSGWNWDDCVLRSSNGAEINCHARGEVGISL